MKKLKENVWRVITILCTVLTAYAVTMENPPSSFAWLLGMLNGFLIMAEMADEEEE